MVSATIASKCRSGLEGVEHEPEARAAGLQKGRFVHTASAGDRIPEGCQSLCKRWEGSE